MAHHAHAIAAAISAGAVTAFALPGAECSGLCVEPTDNDRSDGDSADAVSPPCACGWIRVRARALRSVAGEGGDGRLWLEERCPSGAAAAARCRAPRHRRTSPMLTVRLHIAVGAILPDPERRVGQPHTARLHIGRGELAGEMDVWAELVRRGATNAQVPSRATAAPGRDTGRRRSRAGDRAGDELIEALMCALALNRWCQSALHRSCGRLTRCRLGR